MSIGGLIAINELISAATANKNKDKNNNDSDKEGFKLLSRANSISDAMRKSIIQFPILISSSSIPRPEIGLQITKQAELEFCRFILMTADLQPIIPRGSTISDHISLISSESLDNNNFSLEILKITEISKEDMSKINSYWYNNFDYNTKIIEVKTMEENILKTSIEEITEYDGVINLKKKNDDLNKKNKDLEKQLNEQNNVKQFDTDDKKDINANRNILSNKEILSKVSGPTMINLKFTMEVGNNNTKDVNVTLSVKAIPQILTTEEAGLIFENYATEKNVLQNIIKFTSGEIKFFRDFLFQMERIKKDQAFKAKFGRHPWFRELEKKKTVNKAIKFSESPLIKKLPFIKDLAVGKLSSNNMPMFTIVSTFEEISANTKIPVRYLLNDNKHINNIIKKLMLLCLVIVETRTDDNDSMCRFYFVDFDEPLIYTFSQLQKLTVGGAKSDVSELIKLMQIMNARG